MRITKEEYEQLQIFKREFNYMAIYIMSDPLYYMDYHRWRSKQKEFDDSNP
jgi:hypothetical protein